MKNLKVIPIAFIFLSISPLCFAETSLLPVELLDGARSLGYHQIDNYYEKRPGMVDPPYVYGVLSGDRELSAVFWAVRNESKNQYALILMKKKNFLKKGKFNIIYKTQNYPRGLSVNKGRKIDLSFFHYIEDLKRAGVGEVLESGILIYDMYDGIGSVFCFNNGKWMIAKYD